jgi:hypothetical protein
MWMIIDRKATRIWGKNKDRKEKVGWIMLYELYNDIEIEPKAVLS